MIKKAMIFRKFPLTGEIGAIILEKDYFNQPLQMITLNPDNSIQHSSKRVDYSTTIMSTRPCKDFEYSHLLQALIDSDYKVRIVNKRKKS